MSFVTRMPTWIFPGKQHFIWHKCRGSRFVVDGLEGCRNAILVDRAVTATTSSASAAAPTTRRPFFTLHTICSFRMGQGVRHRFVVITFVLIVGQTIDRRWHGRGGKCWVVGRLNKTLTLAYALRIGATTAASGRAFTPR